eukprot:1158165-Pelagomonas_calceolata.AAC.9
MLHQGHLCESACVFVHKGLLITTWVCAQGAALGEGGPIRTHATRTSRFRCKMAEACGVYTQSLPTLLMNTYGVEHHADRYEGLGEKGSASHQRGSEEAQNNQGSN